jgi:hypothetical protein
VDKSRTWTLAHIFELTDTGRSPSRRTGAIVPMLDVDKYSVRWFDNPEERDEFVITLRALDCASTYYEPEMLTRYTAYTADALLHEFWTKLLAKADEAANG